MWSGWCSPLVFHEKAGETPQPPARRLVTCGRHICIFKDAHRQTQCVWERLCGMWKNPTPAPPLPNYTAFRGPLSVERFAPAAGCKQVGWTENSFCAQRATVCSAPKHRNGTTGNYKSGAISQQQIWQEQCCTLFELHHSFTQCLFQWAGTMQAVCAWRCGAGDRSPELGGKLQQKPVQIRRDGFVICLKCQLLQKPIPGLRSRIGGLNLQLFPPNCRNCKTIIGTLCRARDQCWQGNR